jgi:hypothetical protein
MGFSLESIIAIPCCLTILAQTTGLALPLARQAKRAADVNAFVSAIGNRSGYTCRYKTITRKSCIVPYVHTCPQKIVESLSMARDLYSMTKTSLNQDFGSDS